jgi:hypothetical protein
MKTAIEQLISEFEELKKTKLYGTSFKALEDCINLSYAKLELEKQQITKGFDDGFKDNSRYQNPNYRDSKQYYEQTFKK